MTIARQPARVNYRVLLITFAVLVVLVSAAFVTHRVQRRATTKRALEMGLQAYQRQDWATACTNLRQYIAQYPDDSVTLRKLARAQTSIRPLDSDAVKYAIYSYRNLMRLEPKDPEVFSQLISLYAAIRDFNEVAYLAGKRLEMIPDDPQAMLWSAKACIALRKPDEAASFLRKTLKRCEVGNDTRSEYAEACLLMSGLALSADSQPHAGTSLEWLDRGLRRDPNSIPVLLRRARLHRTLPSTSAHPRAESLLNAQTDLERVDALRPEDPGVRLTLCAEWMKLNRFDRALVEMEIVRRVDEATILKYFSDINDWVVGRFNQEAELILVSPAKDKGAQLADETLKTLTLPRHRLAVLPSAIRLYLADQRKAEARRSLNEYLDLIHTRDSHRESKEKTAFLQALVASAEEDAYCVINLLEPLMSRNADHAEFWGLLAEAYMRTNQPRRAINAMTQYLRLVPDDGKMLLLLMNAHIQQRNWAGVLQLAPQYKPKGPTDISARLLTIEARMNLAQERSSAPDRSEIDALFKELTDLQKSFPDRSDIRLLKATLAAGQDRIDVAEKELSRGGGNPSDAMAEQLQLVSLYYGSGRVDKAADLCREVCRKYPQKAQAWLTLVEIQKANRQYKEAMSTLLDGLSNLTSPRQKESFRMQIAVLQIQQGDRQAGIRTLREISERAKNDTQVRSLLLSLPEVYRDPVTAQKWVDEIRRIEGDTGLLWRLHQSSLWLNGTQWRMKQKEIFEYLNTCVQADPGWSAPVLLLGDMHERLGQYQNVENLYRRLLSADSSCTDVFDRLVDLLERQKRFGDAREVFRKVTLTPAAVNLRRIRSALKAGDISQAVDGLKLQVQEDTKSVRSLILLARLVYSQSKDIKAAFKYLDQAEAVEPGATAALAARVAILENAGNIAEARRILDERIKKGDAIPALLLRADLFAGTGDMTRADADFRQLAALDKTGQGYELLGKFYLDNQRIDDAVEAWKKGLKAHPENLSMKRRLMKMLFLRDKGDDHAQAMIMLKDLEGRLPDDQDVLWVRSLVLLAERTENSIARAQDNLERIVQLRPTAVEAHLQLINLAIQRQDLTKARDLAIHALAANPDNRDLIVLRAQTELGLKDVQTAGDLARMVLKEAPANTDALNILLAIAAGVRTPSAFQELRSLVDRAIRLHPEDERLWVVHAAVLRNMGQTNQAFADLEKFLQKEKNESSIPVLLALSDLHRTQGRFDLAERYLLRAEKVDPMNPLVRRERIIWLGDQKKYDRIIALTTDLRAKREKSVGDLDAAASILASSRNAAHVTEAIAILEYLTTLAPQAVDVHLRLAWLVYQKGDSVRAETIYRRILTLDPNNLQAINNLAWILSDARQDHQQALKLANHGLSLAPEDINLLDTRGTILLKLPDQVRQARTDFEACVRLAPPESADRARALVKLGRICVKLGDVVQAGNHLDAAAMIDVRHPVFTNDERSEIRDILKHLSSSPQGTVAKAGLAP